MTDIHRDLSLRTRVEVSFGCHCNSGLSLATLRKLMKKKRRHVAVPKYSIFSTWHVRLECPKHEADRSLQRVSVVGMQTVLC